MKRKKKKREKNKDIKKLSDMSVGVVSESLVVSRWSKRDPIVIVDYIYVIDMSILFKRAIGIDNRLDRFKTFKRFKTFLKTSRRSRQSRISRSRR